MRGQQVAGEEPSIFEFRGQGSEKNKNHVVDYLTHTSVALGGDVHRYKAIWQRDMHLQMTDTVEKDLLLTGLKQVNRGLVTQDDVDFCLMALDVVDETSKVPPTRDFRMFCTIAALSERVRNMCSVMLPCAWRLSRSPLPAVASQPPSPGPGPAPT